MAQALQAEVGADVLLDAVLASSGGGIKGGQALWRGRAAQIGLLTTQLAAARQRLVGDRLWMTYSLHMTPIFTSSNPLTGRTSGPLVYISDACAFS